jgi:hypothetical protein
MLTWLKKKISRRVRTYDDNIRAAFGRWLQRPMFADPVSLSMLCDPAVHCRFFLLRDAQLGVCDALEDIMETLRDAEDAWFRLWNVPAIFSELGVKKLGWGGKVSEGLYSPPQIDPDCPREAHKRVSHQRYAAALGGAAEERDFGLPLLQFRRVVQHRVPSDCFACFLVVGEYVHVRAEPGVDLHDAAIPDLQQRRETRTKGTVVVSLMKVGGGRGGENT